MKADEVGDSQHLRERIQAAASSALSPWADPENDDWRDAAADQVTDAIIADLGLEQVGWFVWEDPESGHCPTVDLDYEDLHYFPHRPLYAVKDAETASPKCDRCGGTGVARDAYGRPTDDDCPACQAVIFDSSGEADG